MSPPLRRFLLLAVLGAAVVLAVVFGPRLLDSSEASDGPSDRAGESASGETGETGGAAAGDEQPLSVTFVRVVPERLVERLATTGSVQANEAVEVVGEIAGKVRAIHFEEGARVDRGELLVEIDDSELQAERRRIASRLELARLREERQRRLLDEGVVSRQEYDFVATELATLEAELALIDARLVKAEIRAPFAGRAGLRWVSEGSYLSPQTVITTLQDLDPVKLDFSVPEQYVSRVRPGAAVTFRVQAMDRPFEARVYAVDPAIDPATRTLTVRARSPNPRGELVPGAFADVQVVVEEVAEALTVPAIAVVPELGGKKVFVVEDGRAVARPVETGIRTRDAVQIVSGLEAGDRVIVSAIQELRPGLAVAAREETGTAPIRGLDLEGTGEPIGAPGASPATVDGGRP